MGPCPSLSLGSPPPQQHNNRGLKTGGWLLKWPWTSKVWILGADCTFELQTSNYEQMEKSHWKMQDGSSTWPQYCLQEEYWGGIKLTFLLQVLEHQCQLIKVLRTAGVLVNPKRSWSQQWQQRSALPFSFFTSSFCSGSDCTHNCKDQPAVPIPTFSCVYILGSDQQPLEVQETDEARYWHRPRMRIKPLLEIANRSVHRLVQLGWSCF